MTPKTLLNNSEKSGCKPSNEVDVCRPKSGDVSRPSIKQSGMDHCELAVERDVISRMYAASIAANENKAIIDALRPEAEKAVQELLKQQGKPASFSGTIEYNGIKIVVRRPTSYTWEKNNSVQDDNLAYYKKLHACYEQLQTDVKELRADLKRTAEKLAKAHPNSDSIKHGFVIAFGN